MMIRRKNWVKMKLPVNDCCRQNGQDVIVLTFISIKWNFFWYLTKNCGVWDVNRKDKKNLVEKEDFKDNLFFKE